MSSQKPRAHSFIVSPHTLFFFFFLLFSVLEKKKCSQPTHTQHLEIPTKSQPGASPRLFRPVQLQHWSLDQLLRSTKQDLKLHGMPFAQMLIHVNNHAVIQYHPCPYPLLFQWTTDKPQVQTSHDACRPLILIPK
ncbi:hypothetical protein FOQG_08242 [Fusarium oxysporum f. sp. raphani 54005]|uniref:Uncharacterized protein n=1 Tax=Fusarium oxysporum f. sp. raphani 54005 TaxID=1089458 RepID=X0CC29_FUSOX|nr:hypothetical protein FOQG_08242 [Fusarium oxysporum f. sp. raphani 54005]